jgi:rubrerythrin
MNIFDQAMELEREGESLYRQFALEVPDKGMKHIFTWLADQEERHCQIFREMKASKAVTVAESPELRDIKDIFDGWKDSEACLHVKTTQADVYRRALGIEQKSISVYENYASQSADVKQKDIFLKIANEEKRHEWIVENIIEFITKPEAWVENAEFSHLDPDYYL